MNNNDLGDSVLKDEVLCSGSTKNGAFIDGGKLFAERTSILGKELTE